MIGKVKSASDRMMLTQVGQWSHGAGRPHTCSAVLTHLVDLLGVLSNEITLLMGSRISCSNRMANRGWPVQRKVRAICGLMRTDHVLNEKEITYIEKKVQYIF